MTVDQLLQYLSDKPALRMPKTKRW
jgi:hypothetical protein